MSPELIFNADYILRLVHLDQRKYSEKFEKSDVFIFIFETNL